MSENQRIAVIDFGSNSTRLLIVDRKNPFVPLIEKVTVTRLSEGAFATGLLMTEAVERTLKAASEYQQIAADFGATVYAFGTNILREASNSSLFLKNAEKQGLSPEVISGHEEAMLNYHAVKGFFSSDEFLAADLGGGSLELIHSFSGKCNVRSLSIGCVRFSEDYHLGKEELLSDQIRKEIESSGISGRFRDLIGIGGTATTLASIHQELEKFEPCRVQGYSMSRKDLEQLYQKLCKMTVSELKLVKGMDLKRADLVPCGLHILLNVMRYFQAERLVSSHIDLMYGYALKYC